MSLCVPEFANLSVSCLTRSFPFLPSLPQEQLAEETRQKIAANNKAKSLASDVDHLQQQVEDEEEAKQALQGKLTALTQQVCHGASISLFVCLFGLTRVGGRLSCVDAHCNCHVMCDHVCMPQRRRVHVKLPVRK